MNNFIFLLIALFLVGCASTGSYTYSGSTIETPYSKASDAYYKSNYEEAIEYFNQYIDESEEDDVLMDMALFNLANSYKGIGNKDKAIETYEKVIDKFKEGYWVDSAKEEIEKLKD